MSLIKDNKFKLNMLAVLVATPLFGIFAQDAAALAKNSGSDTASLEYLLTAFAFVLLIAVAVLGSIFLKLVKISLDKTAKTLLVLFVSGLAVQNGYAQETAAQASTSASGMSPNLIVISITLFLEVTAVFFFLIKIVQLLKQIAPESEEKKGFEFNMPVFWEKVNAAVPIEKEADVMLDHDYDGIKELDNNLPPWWKYGFYFTIVWAFGYLVYYHVMGAGPLSIDSYQAEMEEARIQKELFMRDAKNNVDESSVLMADAAGIADGASIYKSNCAACHGNLGEGNVGPNLTDTYWIHGGDLKSIFKSVRYGIPANGMKAWESDLSPVQMQNVSSFIKTLTGTNPPNPKAAQGDLFEEGGTAKAATDSTAVVAIDSSAVTVAK
jgi:cytochrome c oxidase cbb3-type subunit III